MGTTETPDDDVVVPKLGFGARVVEKARPTKRQPVTTERLQAENHKIRRENEQFRSAVAARLMIERAKGVLIERLDLSADDVSELLGLSARRSRRSVHELAEEILKTRVTPACIDLGHLRHAKRLLVPKAAG
jgi:hypothetical protein